jgi:tellurite resistance protein TerC
MPALVESVSIPWWVWVAFNAVVLILLATDLTMFRRRREAASPVNSALWTTGWVSLSLVIGALIWRYLGHGKGIEFFTGYLIEYALSVDNIFVFVMIFAFFGVKREHQHGVLFWGILAAILLRGAMIFAGVALIERFHWLLYVFGLLLVLTGVKMFAKVGGEDASLEKNWTVRMCRRFLPMTPEYRGAKYFVAEGGRLLATPLFLVFLVVNITDVVFAVDSIPAIFGITLDPFIVYSSNICAVLGLRSLYFLLAHVVSMFRFLQQGLSIVLVFIGVKMLIAHWIKIPTGFSLAVVGAILFSSIVVSIAIRPKKTG